METVVDLLIQTSGTIDAVALGKLLIMHPKSIYKKAREGVIPSYRIGAAVLFDRAEIASWLTAKKRG
jgi:excisionase family DNA binding protein